MRMASFLLLVSVLGVNSVTADRLPNIVYILADDFGYGDTSCYNPKSKIQTPHIDRLAKEGMSFLMLTLRPRCARRRVTGSSPGATVGARA